MLGLDFDLDAAIEHLKEGSHLEETVLAQLLTKTLEILFSEETLLSVSAPITIVGDVHGQLFDVLEMFRVAGDPGHERFLFLGDYVDRGYFSIETFALLCAYKIKYSDSVFLLRGNHECRAINEVYGFYNECLQIYGHPGIWILCNEVFDMLPIGAIIENRIFSIHGGLSPTVSLVEQVSLLDRNKELPRSGPIADLCWSDPDNIDGWRLNQRGAGYIFGENPVLEFCHNNKLDLVTRAHQLIMAGYEYKFEDKLVTVWSAPNYMYTSQNDASILKIGSDMKQSVTTFKAVDAAHQKTPEPFVLQYFA